MSKLKSALWEELIATQRGDICEPEPCECCGEEVAAEGDLCRDCWSETNGQFGVGA